MRLHITVAYIYAAYALYTCSKNEPTRHTCKQRAQARVILPLRNVVGSTYITDLTAQVKLYRETRSVHKEVYGWIYYRHLYSALMWVCFMNFRLWAPDLYSEHSPYGPVLEALAVSIYCSCYPIMYVVYVCMCARMCVCVCKTHRVSTTCLYDYELLCFVDIHRSLLANEAECRNNTSSFPQHVW